MKRIINHWTGGGGRANSTDKKHYHMLTEHDGNIVKGKEEIEDNIVTSDGDYAAHTRNLNTDSIGLAMCGMIDAKEYPFDPGPAPLTEKQFRNHAILNADMCRTYGIPVTRETVLFHAEVEPTLGVKQNGKWDVTRLPWNSSIVGALSVGDHFREIVREVLGEAEPALGRPILRIGNKSPRVEVQALQIDLAALGYHSGKADGLFGSRTKKAVIGFQSDQGLIADGIVGPQTWAAMERASALPKRDHTEQTLREAGSRHIKAADNLEKWSKGGAVTTATPLSIDTALAAATKLQNAETTLGGLQSLMIEKWPVLIALGGCYLVWKYGPQIADLWRGIRLDEAKTGENLSK